MKHFLLIDDDEIFANLLQRGFKRRELVLDWAKNRAEALALNDAFDGIILDLNLNHESGLRLLPELVQHFPDSKIIILTGFASISTAVKAIKMGAVQYLQKPADIDAILNAFYGESAENDLEIPTEQPSLKRMTWEHIQYTLEQNNGNISATARVLDMHRRTLQRMLAKKPVKK